MAASVAVVDRPDTASTNRHYPSNRMPLAPSPLVTLPVGAVRPHGWLRKQLELQAAGFHGHLTEISAFLKKEDNAWLSPTGEGSHGWEEVPYWLKGFGDCAYLLNNEDQIREARIWLEGVFASQRADGYFGPRPGLKSTVESTSGNYDLWPNMVMLCCLQSYYEYTGDARVLDLMRRYFRWELDMPESDFLPPYWQKIRAGDNLWSVYWFYNRTGEPWLLELAAKIHRHTANWTDGVCDWHNVNLSQAFGGPGFFWMQSRDPNHLQAAERNWRTIRTSYGEVPGGMFGGDENCRPGYTDPRQAVETCGMVEMMFSHERLLNVTGHLIWADRCEDVAFNSLPAALTADFKALRYLTAPNLVRSDRHTKAPGYQNGGPMLHMNPHLHRCCQHNVGHGWPYLTEHLWMATPDNGLAAVLYGPSEVKARVGQGIDVVITENTRYPFEENLVFEVAPAESAAFPLYLRIPGWCAKPELKVNGRRVKTGARPLSYVRVDRTWQRGDRVQLRLPMEVSVRTWPKNHDCVSVERGPLTYSLQVGEQVVQEGGTVAWPAFEILPTTPWNYGLDLDPNTPTRTFRVVTQPWPLDDMPFTQHGVPIRLVAQGQRIPEWKEDRLGLVGLLQPSPVQSTEPVEKLTLVPMGAARLRISSFPIIGRGPDARVWQGPPPASASRAEASHCNESDTVDALDDRRVPAASNDQSIPRFTWWDRKGTAEWVEYQFEKPRKAETVAVYWFEDTPAGGCALPASWKVMTRNGDAWREVEVVESDPVAPNRFNRIRFKPVETRALRLAVQLKAGYSGGVLEWQVE